MITVLYILCVNMLESVLPYGHTKGLNVEPLGMVLKYIMLI